MDPELNFPLRVVVTPSWLPVSGYIGACLRTDHLLAGLSSICVLGDIMQDATTANEPSYLNPATTEFLKQFRDGLSSVRDLTGEFVRSRWRILGCVCDLLRTVGSSAYTNEPLSLDIACM